MYSAVGPRFTRKPSNIRRTTGHHISLSCAATGVPVPKLSWLRNGTKLTADGRIRITWFEGGTDLKIVNITTGDTGMYQCFAENEVGIIQVSASLIVHSTGEPCTRFFVVRDVQGVIQYRGVARIFQGVCQIEVTYQICHVGLRAMFYVKCLFHLVVQLKNREGQGNPGLETCSVDP